MQKEKPTALQHKVKCKQCGQTVWAKTNGSFTDETGSAVCGTTHHFHDQATIVRLSMKITNRYELYPTETTVVFGAFVQKPQRPFTPKSLNEWALEWLFDFTGVGHEDGDSSYTVKITYSDIPELAGTEYEFGG